MCGSTISWESDNPGVISNDGKVTRSLEGEDQTVTLTANLTRNMWAQGVGDNYDKDSRTFTYTVKAYASVQEMLDETADRISAYQLTQEPLKGITKNLDLTLAGLEKREDVTVSWASNNQSAISNEGVVQRGQEDQTVTLTATVQKGETSVKRDFPFRVLASGADPAVNEAFNGAVWPMSPESENIKTVLDKDPAAVENQTMRIHKTAYVGTSQFATKSFAAQQGTVLAEMRLYGDPNSNEKIRYGVDFLYGENVTLAEIHMDYGGHCISVATGASTQNLNVTMPAYQTWYDMQVLLDTTAKTFDIFINGVKQNTAPMAFKDAYTDEGIVGVRYSVHRDNALSPVPADVYVDDVIVRTVTDANCVQLVKDVLTVPGTITGSASLPTSLYGTSITYSTQPQGVITQKGTVAEPYGFGSTQVILTATIQKGAASETKEFAGITVKQLPPYVLEKINYADAQGGDSDVITPGGKVKSVTVTKNTAEDGPVKLCLVVMDDQVPVAIAVQDVSAAGEVTLGENGIVLPADTGKTKVKVMILESFDSMVPAALALTNPVQ